ncbi:MAG TPA: uroporphyrinogen-III synthase, partial [Candidatus Polarisedimenticolia bacterium]|nr:uroporphyrinogen-III synthase [Candidatus Polarisedimenticolia bacterium]
MSGLRGCTILNTRSADQSGGLSAALQALGATVVEAPLIAFEDPSDPRALHEALGRLASYDWLLLTSANAVRRLAAGLRAAPPASPLPPIAAVGRATAAAAASELGAAPRVTARDS